MTHLVVVAVAVVVEDVVIKALDDWGFGFNDNLAIRAARYFIALAIIPVFVAKKKRFLGKPFQASTFNVTRVECVQAFGARTSLGAAILAKSSWPWNWAIF